MHTSAAGPTTLWVPGDARSYLHDVRRSVEYLILPGSGPGHLSKLHRKPSSRRQKGAVLDALRNIFQSPFDPAAFRRAIHARQTQPASSQWTELALGEATDVDGAPARSLLTAAYDMRTGYLDQAGLLHGLALGYTHRIGPVHLGAMLSYAHCSYLRADGIAVIFHELTVGPTVEWRYRIMRRLRLRAGLDVGLVGGWQYAENEAGDQLLISEPLFRYQLRLGADFRVAGPLFLQLEGQGGQAILLKPDGVKGPFFGGLRAGVGLEF